jgi:hypothetical protein
VAKRSAQGIRWRTGLSHSVQDPLALEGGDEPGEETVTRSDRVHDINLLGFLKGFRFGSDNARASAPEREHHQAAAVMKERSRGDARSAGEPQVMQIVIAHLGHVYAADYGEDSVAVLVHADSHAARDLGPHVHVHGAQNVARAEALDRGEYLAVIGWDQRKPAAMEAGQFRGSGGELPDQVHVPVGNTLAIEAVLRPALVGGHESERRCRIAPASKVERARLGEGRGQVVAEVVAGKWIQIPDSQALKGQRTRKVVRRTARHGLE